MADIEEPKPAATAVVITENDLLAAGYYRINDHPKRADLKEWFRGSFQKRFRDERGTRYFIEVVLGELPPIMNTSVHAFCSPSAQFRRSGTCFNIDLLRHTETISEFHGFFDEMWRLMQCDYYELDAGEAEFVQVDDMTQSLSTSR